VGKINKQIGWVCTAILSSGMAVRHQTVRLVLFSLGSLDFAHNRNSCIARDIVSLLQVLRQSKVRSVCLLAEDSSGERRRKNTSRCGPREARINLFVPYLCANP